MKITPFFRNYLRDLEGYHSNKIENPNLTYSTYKVYSKLDRKKTTEEKDLKELGKLYNDKKISDENLEKEFLKRELRNYQNVIEKYLIHDENLWKKITIDVIKDISKILLSEITEHPFDKEFTPAFQPHLNKEQIFEKKNIAGDFRKTPLIKGDINFRPAKTIEKDIKKILNDTYKVLDDSNSSIEQKILSLALFHLNFEFIHPFAEGNGRAGRILINILSIQNKIIPPAFGAEINFDSNDTKLTFINPKLYKEIINSVLFAKEEQKDWKLIRSVPEVLENFYYKSLIETINLIGEKNEKDLMEVFYLDYTIEERFYFEKFINHILKKNIKIIKEDSKKLEKEKRKLTNFNIKK